MYNFFMFLPRCFFYVISMGGWNWFPKTRTAALPKHIFYITLAPVFGVDMKPLIKGISGVLGKNLEEVLTEMEDGFQPGRNIGLRVPTYTDVEGFIRHCQGVLEEGEETPHWMRASLHNPGMLVSDETLVKIKQSKCLTLYHEDEYTESVYESHRQYKNRKFLVAATKVLNAKGAFEDDCPDCGIDLLSQGLDEDGDCRNCNEHLCSEELLTKTINDLQKEAA